MKFNALIFVAGLIVSQTGFATDPPQYAHLSKRVTSNNLLGMKLFQSVTDENLKKSRLFENTLVSPLSAYAALSMLNTGLQGNTQDQLLTVLSSKGAAVTEIDKQNKELLTALIAEDSTKAKRFPGEKRKATVGIYNSAWANNGATNGEKYIFTPTYLKSLDAYQAEVQSLDFVPQSGADAVNHWANRTTRGLIPQIITQDVMKEMSWILMNATYIEANWLYDFYKSPKSVATPFQLLSGVAKSVETIRSTASYQVASTADVDMIELPFYDSDLAFYALQPKTTLLFEQMLTDGRLSSAKLWTELMGKLEIKDETVIALEMPKFSFGNSAQMRQNESLTRRMGLNFLFDSANARDFDSMGLIHFNGSPVAGTVVGLIKQDTKIELDENGVKAAAVTLVGGVVESAVARPPKIEKFVIDKPFQFVIASRSTGAILFIGTVVNP